MRVQIFQMLLDVALSVSNWFTVIFHKTDTIGIYLGAIVIVLCVRLLLAPLLGASLRIGASDTVKRWRNQRDEEDS